MITAEIIQYIFTITRGMVTITNDQAQSIIDLVNDIQQEAPALVIQSKYNGVKNSYEKLFTQTTTDAVLYKRLQELGTPRPVFFCYTYQFINSAGDCLKTIYSAHPELF